MAVVEQAQALAITMGHVTQLVIHWYICHVRIQVTCHLHIQVTCYDWDNDGSHDLIGFFTTSLSEIMEAEKTRTKVCMYVIVMTYHIWHVCVCVLHFLWSHS